MAAAGGHWKSGGFVAPKGSKASIDSRKASETKGAWVSAVNDAARTGSATAANTAVREYMKWSESLGRPKTREQAESFVFGRIGEEFSGQRRSPFRAENTRRGL